jgi:hypothetical protein
MRQSAMEMDSRCRVRHSIESTGLSRMGETTLAKIRGKDGKLLSMDEAVLMVMEDLDCSEAQAIYYLNISFDYSGPIGKLLDKNVILNRVRRLQ